MLQVFQHITRLKSKLTSKIGMFGFFYIKATGVSPAQVSKSSEKLDTM